MNGDTEAAEPHEPAADVTNVAADVVGDTHALAPVEAELPPFAEYNLIGKFEEPSKARDAIVALERAGIDGSKISYLALDQRDSAQVSKIGRAHV